MSEQAVLGLDFGGTKIAAAVADLSGRRLGDCVVGTDPSRGARWNFERGVAAGRALAEESAPAAELVAVGACTFGIPRTHQIHLAPAIPGWSELSLGLELTAAFGTRAVSVATDVKAAAEAEVRSGALAGHDPAVYLNLGTGLAVAIIVGGQVVRGANGAAGEIAYCVRRPRDLEPAAAGRVILEDAVSGMALAAKGSALAGRELSAAGVFAAAGSDARLGGLVDDFIRELSFHVVNLAIAVDPARIAVGGGITGSWDRIGPPLRRALDTRVPYPPELVLGAYPLDAALVGAVTLGLEAASEYLAEIGESTAGVPAATNGRPATDGRPTADQFSSDNVDRSDDLGRV